MRGLGQTTDATGALESGVAPWGTVGDLPADTQALLANPGVILPTDYGPNTQLVVSPVSSSIPSWVWIGAAAVIGFAFFVGGRR